MEIDTIKFDIAVSASSKKQGELGGSLNVFSAKLGTRGQAEKENSEISRIEFTLGVAWPHTSIEDAKRLRRASAL
ncbi:MAG TPA: hypothetical protein VGX71_25510 [Pseudaminobacter sp.]|jgi:hypothetical protein|nr:hypothetical protein [Pseudaminobacter sp.]